MTTSDLHLQCRAERSQIIKLLNISEPEAIERLLTENERLRNFPRGVDIDALYARIERLLNQGAELETEVERLRGLFVRIRDEGHDKQCCKDLDDLVTEALKS